jgi:hypothetical protein
MKPNRIKPNRINAGWLTLLALSTINYPLSTAHAQGTAFTYQGRLNNGGSPANGLYDFRFRLDADPEGDTVLGTALINALGVTNGLFSTTIDFGAGRFNGSSCWLEVDVRTNNPGNTLPYTPLFPFQAVTPTPYAVYANTASNVSGTVAAGQISGTVPLARLSGLTSNQLDGATWQLATNLNGGNAALASNVVSGIAITNAFITNSVFAGNGSGLTNLNASQLSSGTIPLAQLPIGVITNDATNLTIGGTNAVAPLTMPPTVPAAAIGSVGTGQDLGPIAVAGRYAYVVGSNSSTNTLQIFDVSNPTTPVSVGSVGAGIDPSSVAVAGRYAYVVNYAGGTLQVFDVGNPSMAVSVGSVGTGTDPTSVAVVGRYAYVVGWFYYYIGGTLQIFDVSNPSAPVSVGSAYTGGLAPCSVAVAGRYAYVANQGSTNLQILDVSSPSAPILVGSVGTGDTPSSVAVAGRYAYVANQGYRAGTNYANGTLKVLDVSNPSAPISVGSVGTGSDPSSIAVAGRYAYVVNWGSGTLQLFDVSNPSAPVSVGSVGTGSDPMSVAVAGRYAYVVGGSGLQVFDLGGAYIQQFEAGAMETGTLQTRDTVTVGNNLNVRGGLTVSASARISGGLSVDNGAITASNFSGNGAGLTNVPAKAINGGFTTNILIGGRTFYYTNGVLMNIQ